MKGIILLITNTGISKFDSNTDMIIWETFTKPPNSKQITIKLYTNRFATN